MEMSCLMFRPSWACASGMLSRMCQSALRLRHALGDHGVAHAALFHGGLQQALELRARMGLGLVVRVLQHHAPGRLLPEGHALLREVLDHQAERELAHDLEAGQAGAQVLVRQAQQLDRVFQRGHGGQGRQLRLRQRIELHGGAGDHTQRAFGADEEVAQVVAGVVLAQAGQAVPDLALRRHHFQAQAELARVAVAHHLRAAGVGAQVAADGAAALRGQAQGEQETGFLALFLQALQHAAGVHGDGEVAGIEAAHLVHAREAQHHLGAAGVGGGAHHHAGVAALRHHGHARGGAGLHDGRHFGGGGRPHHGQRAAALTLAPVQFPGGEVASR